MLKSALKYLKSISSHDFVSLASHHDADGLSSAALIDIFLKRHRGREADYITINAMPPTSLVRNLKTTISDKIIITDLALADAPVIKKIMAMAPTLLIDHHAFSSFPRSERLVYYNPRRRKKDTYQSASYLAYDLTSRITSMDDKLWIAVVGIVGDYDISCSKDLLKKARKKYPEIEMDIKSLLKTDFGKISNIIYAVKSNGKYPMSEMVRVMESANSPGEFLSDRRVEKYLKIYESMNQEIEKEIARTKTDVEQRGRIVFFELRSRGNITSIIANIIADENRDKIVVIYEKSPNKVKISVRNQSKEFDVGNLIKEAVSQIPGATGGGHPAAGGGQVPASKWEEFKSILIGMVSEI